MGEIIVQQVTRNHYGSQECGLDDPQQSLGCALPLDTPDDKQMTPTYLQSILGPFQMATLLLYHGANLNGRKNESESLLSEEVKGEYYIQVHCAGITQRLTKA